MTKKMNEKLFWAIKTMLNGGATIAETAEFFKLGLGTVGRVKASENMDEYHAILAAMYAKKKAATPAPQDAQKAKAAEVTQPDVKLPVQTMIMRPTHELMMEMRKTNELLALISNKLAYIVEQLT